MTINEGQKSALKITPKRRELLQAIADGEIRRDEFSSERRAYWGGRTVTAEVHRLIGANLACLAEYESRWRLISLTSHGKAVLDATGDPS